MAFASYQGATRCSGSSSPGALALMKWALERGQGARNLGIYNCRSVRGGSTTSLHGEGRACDIGMPMSAGRGSAAGHKLVEELRRNAAALGIQAIIYDRRIWSAKSPGGRPYTGVAPHYDHLHVELNRTGASRLTVATIRSVLGGTKPAPAKPASPKDEEISADGTLAALAAIVAGDRPALKKGARGPEVALMQRFIGTADDGIFGPNTEKAVKDYQSMRKLVVDGIAGPKTLGPIVKSLD